MLQTRERTIQQIHRFSSVNSVSSVNFFGTYVASMSSSVSDWQSINQARRRPNFSTVRQTLQKFIKRLLTKKRNFSTNRIRHFIDFDLKYFRTRPRAAADRITCGAALLQPFAQLVLVHCVFLHRVLKQLRSNEWMMAAMIVVVRCWVSFGAQPTPATPTCQLEAAVLYGGS